MLKAGIDVGVENVKGVILKEEQFGLVQPVPVVGIPTKLYNKFLRTPFAKLK